MTILHDTTGQLRLNIGESTAVTYFCHGEKGVLSHKGVLWSVRAKVDNSHTGNEE